MNTNEENLLDQELISRVDKISEALRPLLTEIVKEENSPQQAEVDEIPMTQETPESQMHTEVISRLNGIQDFVQELTYKDKINKELHEELLKHQNGLRKEFITPLLKFIIREYDRIVQQHTFYQAKEEEELQGELFNKLLKEYNIIAFSLLDLLSDYGLEPYEAKEGEEFKASLHKIFKVTETDKPELNSKIAKNNLCGFRDIENEKTLRLAEITIYKYKESENNG